MIAHVAGAVRHDDDGEIKVLLGLRERVWVIFIIKPLECLAVSWFSRIDSAAETGMILQWLLYAKSSV
ncbi:MAG: hypothetical protein Q8L93_12135, partial [Rhodocyclaceae bacterium]|nr:hypothetical protein [Rhodocyclaceae bacterium]MDP1957699.1 hypothetical protein [Rhodocyclaceae bacterium]